MLTIFAQPKPFVGHIGNIQRNAIGSWLQLKPSCEIILFGDEEGTDEVAREFGLLHVPDIAKNIFGTPLLHDLFNKAQTHAKNQLLCYANSDIIFLDDFSKAINRIRQEIDRFLMIGECWNLELIESRIYTNPDWVQNLRALIRERGVSRGPWFIDYFVFSRDLYSSIPEFALGRAGFDNWLIWKARKLKATVVDATPSVLAVHQDHDYSHVSGGREWSYNGDEAARNLELAGGRRRYFITLDATHYLTADGLKLSLGRFFRLKFRWESSREWILAAGWRLPWWLLMKITKPFREPMGLHIDNWRRFKDWFSKWLNLPSKSIVEKKNAPPRNNFRWNTRGRAKSVV